MEIPTEEEWDMSNLEEEDRAKSADEERPTLMSVRSWGIDEDKLVENEEEGVLVNLSECRMIMEEADKRVSVVRILVETIPIVTGHGRSWGRVGAANEGRRVTVQDEGVTPISNARQRRKGLNGGEDTPDEFSWPFVLGFGVVNGTEPLQGVGKKGVPVGLGCGGVERRGWGHCEASGVGESYRCRYAKALRPVDN